MLIRILCLSPRCGQTVEMLRRVLLVGVLCVPRSHPDPKPNRGRLVGASLSPSPSPSPQPCAARGRLVRTLLYTAPPPPGRRLVVCLLFAACCSLLAALNPSTSRLCALQRLLAVIGWPAAHPEADGSRPRLRSVLVRRGSIVQLIVGTIFCAVYLVVQMQAGQSGGPYRNACVPALTEPSSCAEP